MSTLLKLQHTCETTDNIIQKENFGSVSMGWVLWFHIFNKPPEDASGSNS